jgi:capsular exopolysaccharide synthesis family protein
VDKPFKSLLITSAGPMEGKTDTVANLGTVLAQTGIRVIIVDCDLRRPELHTKFGLSNNKGLTNLLVGSAGIEDVLQDTSIPGLQVVTSGPMAPNPSELLQSEKAKSVLAELADMADFVLSDSPPALIRSDAAVLSSLLDGVLLVIKAGKTKIDAVKQAGDRLKRVNARIIGTVLNGV